MHAWISWFTVCLYMVSFNIPVHNYPVLYTCTCTYTSVADVRGGLVEVVSKQTTLTNQYMIWSVQIYIIYNIYIGLILKPLMKQVFRQSLPRDINLPCIFLCYTNYIYIYVWYAVVWYFRIHTALVGAEHTYTHGTHIYMYIYNIMYIVHVFVFVCIF